MPHRLPQRSKSVKFDVKPQPVRKLFTSVSNPSFRPSRSSTLNDITFVRFVPPARTPSTGRAHFKRHSLRDNSPSKVAVPEVPIETLTPQDTRESDRGPLENTEYKPPSLNEDNEDGQLSIHSSARKRYIARARRFSHYIKKRTKSLFMKIIKRSQQTDSLPVQHVEAQHAPLFVDRTRESTGYKRLSTGLMSPQTSEDMPFFTPPCISPPVTTMPPAIPCDLIARSRQFSAASSDARSGFTSWNDESVTSRHALVERETEKAQLGLSNELEPQRLSVINESFIEQTTHLTTFPPIKSTDVYNVLTKRLIDNSPEAKLAAMRCQLSPISSVSKDGTESTESFVGTEARMRIRVPPRSTSVDGLRATVRHVTSRPQESDDAGQVHASTNHSDDAASEDKDHTDRHHLSTNFETSIVSPLDQVVSHTIAHQTTYANIRSSPIESEDDEDDVPSYTRTIARRKHTKSSNSMKSLLGSRRETGSGLFGSSNMVIERTQSPYRKAIAEFEARAPVIPPRRHMPTVISSEEIANVKFGASMELPRTVSPPVPGQAPMNLNISNESIYSRSAGAQTPGITEALEKEIGMFPIPVRTTCDEVDHGTATIVGSTTYSPKKRAFEKALKVFKGDNTNETTEEGTTNDSTDWRTWLDRKCTALERNKSLEMSRAAPDPASTDPAGPEAVIMPEEPALPAEDKFQETLSYEKQQSPLERHQTSRDDGGIPGFVTPTRPARQRMTTMEEERISRRTGMIRKGKDLERDRDSPGRRLANKWMELKKKDSTIESGNDTVIESSDAAVFL